MATIALVGADGNLGYKLLPEFVASPSIKQIHNLSRKPNRKDEGKVTNFQVEYNHPETLVAALKGCHVLVNAMGTQGNFEDSKRILVDAAAKAGVKFYIPRHVLLRGWLMLVNLGLMFMLTASRFDILVGRARLRTMSMLKRKACTLFPSSSSAYFPRLTVVMVYSWNTRRAGFISLTDSWRTKEYGIILAQEMCH
jgi:hypothetical protein